ncbi:MAG TPA: thiamine pyrophosphate-dependent enzyme [Bacteroidia bacterium]|nr:thiamine pyrophosphate-dependent enzyme [Bacteroidia bacterium]
MNVCEALLEVLSQYHVKYIFGIPGDAINELIEAVRKQNKIKFIHVMHEETGAFAASAQAKLSGSLAVCVGTAGPGSIHLLNGLYDAKKDHAPVLAITGQIETSLLGTNYHQEVDLIKLFQDVSVYNQMLVDVDQLPGMITYACQAAIANKGVAHINIPVNISGKTVKPFKSQKYFNNKSFLLPHVYDIQAAAVLINNARKTCILIGIGAIDAVNELLQFAELIKAPIIKSLRGKDILPDLHPLTLGGIGLLGTEASYKAIKECDLMITIGSDLPYSEFYPDKDVPVIQIDNNIEQVGRRFPATIGLVGDAKLTLIELLNLVIEKEESTFLKECQMHMKHWLKKQDEKELSDKVPLHPQMITRTVSDFADDDAIICCDTGAVTVWGARNFRLKGKQRFTLSGGLASMAFGLPAAIGAKLLYPKKQVIALCGDGGFAMLMCDFATAIKYNLNIKIIIFNNAKLGLIQMEEEARSGNPEYETELCDPNYAMFANSCGGEGYTVSNSHELKSVLSIALKSNKPAIINVYVNANELTMPPKISASQALNFIKAKIKETFI